MGKIRGRLIGSLLIASLFSAYGQEQEMGHRHEAEAGKGAMGQANPEEDHHQEEAMHGFYGPYPMTRDASGTAWQPEATPMGGLHIMRGDWMIMAHGYLNAIYDYQSGPRGDQKFFSESMFMGMAQHPLGPGTLGMRAMLTLEPATIGKTGYPELLQTGETANGVRPLIDRLGYVE